MNTENYCISYCVQVWPTFGFYVPGMHVCAHRGYVNVTYTHSGWSGFIEELWISLIKPTSLVFANSLLYGYIARFWKIGPPRVWEIPKSTIVIIETLWKSSETRQRTHLKETSKRENIFSIVSLNSIHKRYLKSRKDPPSSYSTADKYLFSSSKFPTINNPLLAAC